MATTWKEIHEESARGWAELEERRAAWQPLLLQMYQLKAQRDRQWKMLELDARYRQQLEVEGLRSEASMERTLANIGERARSREQRGVQFGIRQDLSERTLGQRQAEAEALESRFKRSLEQRKVESAAREEAAATARLRGDRSYFRTEFQNYQRTMTSDVAEFMLSTEQRNDPILKMDVDKYVGLRLNGLSIADIRAGKATSGGERKYEPATVEAATGVARALADRIGRKPTENELEVELNTRGLTGR
jgi:hypothetical protein